ncbi:tRNA pseudouridine synthase B [Porphyridium purpureum]|uniref:tRNA pseudouridine(55) synthase n=1 Tax=Porphyridium purpureum TaxID=35688 RepID=A0A5J4Z8D3_PORPP|nr:tRNA pseudouridine synthase B [Porphyridium purpureum]|eukprot:POR3114..scf295_1
MTSWSILTRVMRSVHASVPAWSSCFFAPFSATPRQDRIGQKRNAARRSRYYRKPVKPSRPLTPREELARLQNLGKKMKRYEAMRDEMAAEAEKKGAPTVPECHFLVLDKPHTELGATVARNARRFLCSNVLDAALESRYYRSMVEGWSSQSGLSTKKRSRARSLRSLEARMIDRLEPFATGVLVLAIEGATGIANKFLDATHEYEATAMFGTATDTQYSYGAVVQEREFAHVTEEALKKMIKRKFLGRVVQTPPLNSHVMVLDRPLVHYNQEMTRGRKLLPGPRPVQVLAFDVLEFDLPRVRFRIECKKNTFVRTLVHDLAQAVGSCAHLTALRRTRFGEFKIEYAVTGELRRMPLWTPKIVEYMIHADQVMSRCLGNDGNTFSSTPPDKVAPEKADPLDREPITVEETKEMTQE